MTITYQIPSVLDAVACEIVCFARKAGYEKILQDYIKERPEDLKGMRQKATMKALAERGMDRRSAGKYNRKIRESYRRYKSCTQVLQFSLPMNRVKAFTSRFKHCTFPRLRSYKQVLVSVQERCVGLRVYKNCCWTPELGNNPFFAALMAPANIWAPSPSSETSVECRVLTSYKALSEMKYFIRSENGSY